MTNMMYQTKASAIAHVNGMVASGSVTTETDENGYVWIHPGTLSSRCQDSVYSNSLDSAIEEFAIDRAKFIGFDWAFELDDRK